MITPTKKTENVIIYPCLYLKKMNYVSKRGPLSANDKCMAGVAVMLLSCCINTTGIAGIIWTHWGIIGLMQFYWL